MPSIYVAAGGGNWGMLIKTTLFSYLSFSCVCLWRQTAFKRCLCWNWIQLSQLLHSFDAAICLYYDPILVPSVPCHSAIPVKFFLLGLCAAQITFCGLRFGKCQRPVCPNTRTSGSCIHHDLKFSPQSKKL